ncbi:response regulator transcription factor [Thermoflavimicrobium dichotomicum]|uniref:Heme response regulator HssR n=1 Tax=Thermoflavimicrobium dichotomicum TaxID=46223 RepID=A0A1I3K515_9BACL|nr:response regulator transcription factor [Thermoflavimicrobium dichotomicum]SFI67562.1 DNA-binding response regulator, OmpR family, contains REC and winged-helix (wHTH) domain [Thermoflavimicrobium dichotomicum]
MARILVIEDDPHIQRLIKVYLEMEGFEVVQADDGEEALNQMYSQVIDLVILDIMLPYKDGFTICEEIRRSFSIPILMVTAKGERADKVKGFQVGTDDYLVKPFDPVELVMRVKALLRRYQIAFSETISIGEIQLNKREQTVTVAGKSWSLPQKEFQLLFKLVSYPGKTFTRAQLIEQIWGMDYEGDERTVDVHIKRLRQRFKPWADQFMIVTVRGLGYRLEVKK